MTEPVNDKEQSVAPVPPLSGSPVAGIGDAKASAASPATAAAGNVAQGTPGRVVPLTYPFKSGDKTLQAVTFPRRPKAGDLIQGHGASTPAEQELYQIASLLGVNAEDLKEMDGQDYMAVQREWAAFLGVR